MEKVVGHAPNVQPAVNRCLVYSRAADSLSCHERAALSAPLCLCDSRWPSIDSAASSPLGT